MSKRLGSPVARPTKLFIKQEPECVDLTDSPVEQPIHQSTDLTQDVVQTTFTPAVHEPKTRVMQTYVLDYQPRTVVTISLNGVQPEVRFTNPDTSFIMSGVEFLYMADLEDEWPATMLLLNDTQLEPHLRGCRMTHFKQGLCGFDFFDLTEGAVTKLKSKLSAMSTHVRRLQTNKSNISCMFDCVVRALKAEYVRLSVYDPIDLCVDELSRLVMCHVPPYNIVRDFRYNTSGCQLNYYSLLTCVLAQKARLSELLK